MRSAVLLLASLASVTFAAPLAPRGEKHGDKTIISTQDNSQNNGQGEGGLIGIGIDALNGNNVGGIVTGSGNQGNDNGDTTLVGFLPIRRRGGMPSGGKTTVISSEDNSQHNGQGEGGLIGIGADLLNGNTVLGKTSGSNNQGDSNGDTTLVGFLPIRRRGGMPSGGETTVISSEDNSQHNGQGEGGLIGIGIDALNDNTILGTTSGSNNQGDLNGDSVIAFLPLVRRGGKKGEDTTIVWAQDNSQNNGQGSGGLLGLGVNALNDNTVLGVTKGSNNQGNDNGDESYFLGL